MGDRLPLMGLGYVGVGARDPKAWARFGTDVCGLMPARILPGPERAGPLLPTPDLGGVAPDGSLFLKMDDRQWRLAVHPAEQEGLQYFGLELPRVAAVREALDVVGDRGAEVRPGTEEECRARGVGALAVLFDPAGNRVELFSGPGRDKDFVSPHGAEFVTGDLGIGHLFLMVSDMEAGLDFYRRVLDFERSDFMSLGGGNSIQFLRCTRRHHSVGLMRVGDVDRLQHVMFEMRTLDHVGCALDRALAAGTEITASLGRHRNDGTVSFYMKGPSGFDIELGWDGILVGDDWVEHEFAGTGDDWGHHGLMGDTMAESASGS